MVFGEGSHDVSQGSGKLLGVGEVDHFVWSVSVGVWSEHTEGKDEGLWVLLLKFSKEWNGSTDGITSSWLSAVELRSSNLDGVVKPVWKSLHAPSATGMAILNGDLGVVWDISGQFLDQDCFGLLWVHGWAKSHAQSH